MSRKRARSTEATPAAGRSKGGTWGLAALFLVVGAVAGPRVLGGGAAPAAGSAEPTSTTVATGPVVSLDAITLNLSDGRLLQVGVALELAPDAVPHEAEEDDPTHGYAKALDAAIDVLGRQTMAALLAPGGRDQAKAELVEALQAAYHGEVVGVFFHRFVMQ